jgi:hypothetical protein
MQYFSYIQDKNKFNNILKTTCIYRNGERDWSTRSMTFDCHRKSTEIWEGTQNLFFVAAKM